jgi:hypothetical protein
MTEENKNKNKETENKMNLVHFTDFRLSRWLNVVSLVFRWLGRIYVDNAADVS